MSAHRTPRVVLVSRTTVEARRWAESRGLKWGDWEWVPFWAILHRWRGIPLVLLPSMWNRPDAELVADYVEGELRKRGRPGLASFPVAH